MVNLGIRNRTFSSQKLKLPQQKEPDQAPITSATREDENENILAGTSSGVSVSSNCGSRLKQMQASSNSIFGSGGSIFYGNQPMNHENRSCAVVSSDEETKEKKWEKRKEEGEYKNQVLHDIFHDESALAELFFDGVEPPQKKIEGKL
jgi:hypothetical protein